jgi:hypothetical protein
MTSPATKRLIEAAKHAAKAMSWVSDHELKIMVSASISPAALLDLREALRALEQTETGGEGNV